MKERGKGPLAFFFISLMVSLLIIGVASLIDLEDVGFSPGSPQCSNGDDDDQDGFVDLADPDCYGNANDDSEHILLSNFYVGEGQYVGHFSERGDIDISGSGIGYCTPGFDSTCNAFGTSDSFKLKSDDGNIIALFREDSLLCVANEDTCEPSPDCTLSNPNEAFAIKDGNGNVVMYIDENGDLCFEGQIIYPQFLLNLEAP